MTVTACLFTSKKHWFTIKLVFVTWQIKVLPQGYLYKTSSSCLNTYTMYYM